MEAVLLPAVTETSNDVTIVRWLCQEGEYVEPGDELIEVLADDMTFTIVAEIPGFLRQIFFEAGDIVRYDQKIAEVVDREEVE